MKTLALVQEKFKNKSKFLFWNNTKTCKHKTKILPITTCIKVIHMHDIAYMYKVMSVPSFNKNFPKNIGTVLETFTADFFGFSIVHDGVKDSNQIRATSTL